jgi:hypothetical protein
MVQIEILYFDGCPTHKPALELVRRIVKEERISAHVREIKVSSEAEARALKFPGSPTIRVSGRDVDGVGLTEYGLKCRVYSGPEGLTGMPPAQLIENALKETSRGSAARCC